MPPLLLLLGFLAASAAAFDWDESTPLDEYVFRDDDVFAYEELEELSYRGDGFTMHYYNMTSQTWMDDSVTPDNTWWHYVTVAVPDTFSVTDAALLYIDGGNKNDGPPSESRLRRQGEFCRDVGVPVVSIRCVPFQPTRFTDDLIGRTEDQIIARTWRLYVEEEVDDPEVNLLFPMTKAAKRAVDLMVAEVEDKAGHEVTKVMPTGFSKRGWTAWLLSCVDRRVFAVAPVVLDLLNWNPNLHHHYRAYGGWSWAFQPYWAEGVSKYIDHPRAKEAFDEHAGDPFAYNERLAALPKLIVSGTGDQFFLLDDSHYFFLELLGENNFMQIMENTDHGLGGHTDRLWQNYRSFFVASYEGFEFPRIEQERIVTEDGGEILVNLDRAPKSIRGWYADTTNVTVETDDEGNEVHRRDFRLRTALRNNPIVWEEVAVEQVDDTRFRLAMDLRDGGEGYRGFFIDMTFDGPRDDAPFDELNFATEINIVPDTFPWEQCSSEEECRGSLK